MPGRSTLTGPGKRSGSAPAVRHWNRDEGGGSAYDFSMMSISLSIVAETCAKTTTAGNIVGLVILLGLIGAIVGFAVANARARKQLAAATYELNYLRPEYSRLQHWLAGGSGPAATPWPTTGYGVGTSIPPQWHPDPAGRHELRFWNGTDWSDDVADQGVTSKDGGR